MTPSRRQHFFSFSDANQYATHLETLRQDFRDLLPATKVTLRQPPGA